MTVFCDWLSIYQEHFEGCTTVNDGRIFSVDQDGAVDWDIARKVKHRGSHDTTLWISSDGNRVRMEGNIGRFNRPDNVFGYSVLDCVKLANQVLVGYGLPPFTDSRGVDLADGSIRATGAVITRVDLTKNYLTFSQANASMFIRHLQGFKFGKLEPTSYRTTGVCWGEGSKYHYSKVYDKAADYVRHYGPAHGNHNAELYAYLKDNGVVRHEVELKARYLLQNNLRRMVNWENDMENTVYLLFSSVVSDCAQPDSYQEIQGRAGELAIAWRDGADLKKRLSHNTFYRYRRELLKHGIDIAIPANVARLPVKVEVIQVTDAAAPWWYELPQVA